MQIRWTKWSLTQFLKPHISQSSQNHSDKQSQNQSPHTKKSIQGLFRLSITHHWHVNMKIYSCNWNVIKMTKISMCICVAVHGQHSASLNLDQTIGLHWLVKVFNDNIWHSLLFWSLVKTQFVKDGITK